VPRLRTTKALAQRINLNYFKRQGPMRRVRFWLSVVLPVAGLVWLGWYASARDSRPYSGGGLSAGHAVLTRDCETCHVTSGGSFREQTTNQACVACHDGPIHQAKQTFEPECSSCHVEHRGRVSLVATSDRNCSVCHADLQTKGGGAPNVFRTISSLQKDHPEVTVLRERRTDPGTIKVNHRIHMKPGLRGPNGQPVQMECWDCHRPPASREAWRFSAPGASPAAVVPAAAGGKGDPYAAKPSRALMLSPRFADSCAACHSLQFDKRMAEQVPHDKPDVVRAFVVRKLEAYIAAHPAELRELREPDRTLAEQRPAPAVRLLTPAQWVKEHTDEAELLLWRKTCKQCHTLSSTEGQPLPKVEPANYTVRWMLRARFDHDAHRGFSCVSCHPAALKSQETAEVLLTGISTCKTCHSPGASNAESRCSECHTYHDWTKRKEVTPAYVPHRMRASLPGAPHTPGQ
jgi:hypothetical protein